MVSNMIYLFVEDSILKSQHGFIPERGTLTAWRDFFKRDLNKRKYIYEIDLKQYFPTAHATAVTERLLELGMPK